VSGRPLALSPATNPGNGGPIGWWKLDESGGTKAANAAGNKYEGILHGSGRWVSGQGALAKALELDGSPSWIEIADSSDLDLRDHLAFSAWFKVREFNCPGQTLFSKGESWRLQRQGEKDSLEVLMAGPQTKSRGGSISLTTKRKVDDGEWHHVAVVYDGKHARLYLDGSEEASTPATGPVMSCNLPITIGENDSLRGRYFNGWLGDIRLYDRSLSEEEIRTLGRKN
jgi:hypothetical protein